MMFLQQQEILLCIRKMYFDKNQKKDLGIIFILAIYICQPTINKIENLVIKSAYEFEISVHTTTLFNVGQPIKAVKNPHRYQTLLSIHSQNRQSLFLRNIKFSICIMRVKKLLIQSHWISIMSIVMCPENSYFLQFCVSQQTLLYLTI